MDKNLSVYILYSISIFQSRMGDTIQSNLFSYQFITGLADEGIYVSVMTFKLGLF